MITSSGMNLIQVKIKEKTGQLEIHMLIFKMRTKNNVNKISPALSDIKMFHRFMELSGFRLVFEPHINGMEQKGKKRPCPEHSSTP